MTTSDRTLGIVSSMHAYRHDGGTYVQLAFGRIIDLLASRYRKVYLSLSTADRPPEDSTDYRLAADNIEMIPQPWFVDSMHAMKMPLGIAKSYAGVCKRCDDLYLRGMLPYGGLLYALAAAYGRRPCHWVVGNALALLSSHTRAGRVKDTLARLYAHQDKFCTRAGRWATGGSLVCNGAELGEAYRSPRTYVTVSSTISDEEFYERGDTCRGEKVRILLIGFMRPEKGVEYLIRAVGKLKTDRDWELVLAGPHEKYDEYRKKLYRLVAEEGISDKVVWHEDFVRYGEEMFSFFREADLFVLPTLSEGTPRVLIEARANSLPVVSTTVGGIPTSVTDGVDGLLVEPKDPDALAGAIDRVIEDGELRRELIRNGLKTARGVTVGRFVDLCVEVMENLRSAPRGGPIAAAPEKRVQAGST